MINNLDTTTVSSGQAKECRYGFPKPYNETNVFDSIITRAKDKRGRERLRVDPPRNNGNVNVCAASPLMFIAGRGNQDLQYIANKTGGAEYASKYASKADVADSKAMQVSISKMLARETLRLAPHEHLELRQQLRAVGNAVIASQQVGTVHACYVLGQPELLVQSSRLNIFINPLMRKDITLLPMELDQVRLNEMEDAENVIDGSPSSQFGKRNAYHALWKQQHAMFHSLQGTFPPVTFFAFVSAYRITKEQTKPRGPNSKIVENSHQLFVDENGFITNPVSFTLNMVR